MKTIHIGADSAGYLYKEELKPYLASLGYTVVDEGAEHGNSGTHYPEYAMKVAQAVQNDPENTLGILVCGTGIGMSMVANKFDGVRAAAFALRKRDASEPAEFRRDRREPYSFQYRPR